MSDWEDIFGAGYSAESLIASINHSNRTEQRQQRLQHQKRSGPTQAGFDGDPRSGTDHRFATFDDALAWEKANPGIPFIRRPDGSGYVMRILDR